ncbi:TetR/AcrR family transcriptional regulator [Botryobacter ruber]|uniref:TetR/AcrR family transcriptional regulator n=1 Tax=Botryobacter ruber TaxID=2171629 RepID=UPI000E0AC638|nr:TetR/AcrR family transcriptional regulator [Botryobacter ruber]
MTFIETILEEIVRLFKQNGIEANTQDVIIKKLDIRPSTFQELFSDRHEMVRKAVVFDMEQQKRAQAKLLAKAKNPVEEIMLLVNEGIKDTKELNLQYVLDLQQHYPDVWRLGLDHLDNYSYPLVSEIINKGILEGYFRKDINLHLVTKIIFEQLNMIINPAVFPPERYDLSEVYRSVYLYYIRGICTEQGGKLAEQFFASKNL